MLTDRIQVHIRTPMYPQAHVVPLGAHNTSNAALHDTHTAQDRHNRPALGGKGAQRADLSRVSSSSCHRRDMSAWRSESRFALKLRTVRFVRRKSSIGRTGIWLSYISRDTRLIESRTGRGMCERFIEGSDSLRGGEGGRQGTISDPGKVLCSAKRGNTQTDAPCLVISDTRQEVGTTCLSCATARGS